MTVTATETPWVTLKQGDTGFVLQHDFAVVYRAGIEVTASCPREYVSIIATAYERGWLVPVATVPKTDPTLMWDTLRKE